MSARRRLLLMLLGLTCLVMLVPAGLWLLQPADGPGVNKANYDRVKPGMTRAEVEEIFDRQGIRFDGIVGQGEAYCWQSADESIAIIFFDGQGKVTEPFQWHESNQGVLGKIRRWVRWPWRK